jgi:hypothetical protein
MTARAKATLKTIHRLALERVNGAVPEVKAAAKNFKYRKKSWSERAGLKPTLTGELQIFEPLKYKQGRREPMSYVEF